MHTDSELSCALKACTHWVSFSKCYCLFSALLNDFRVRLAASDCLWMPVSFWSESLAFLCNCLRGLHVKIISASTFQSSRQCHFSQTEQSQYKTLKLKLDDSKKNTEKLQNYNITERKIIWEYISQPLNVPAKFFVCMDFIVHSAGWMLTLLTSSYKPLG